MHDFSKKIFLPVVHCVSHAGDIDHALRNITSAMEAKADGVMLINHSTNWRRLIYIYQEVREVFPDFWMGLNFLDLYGAQDLLSAIKGLKGVGGLWTDVTHPNKRLMSGGRAVFGGLEFKYQPQILSREQEIMRVKTYTTCALTSGPQTDSPPTIEKLHDLKEALGSHPLGVASGVNVKNILGMLPYADVFVVASSVVERRELGEYFIPELLAEMAEIIHTYDVRVF